MPVKLISEVRKHLRNATNAVRNQSHQYMCFLNVNKRLWGNLKCISQINTHLSDILNIPKSYQPPTRSFIGISLKWDKYLISSSGSLRLSLSGLVFPAPWLGFHPELSSFIGQLTSIWSWHSHSAGDDNKCNSISPFSELPCEQKLCSLSPAEEESGSQAKSSRVNSRRRQALNGLGESAFKADIIKKPRSGSGDGVSAY